MAKTQKIDKYTSISWAPTPEWLAARMDEYYIKVVESSEEVMNVWGKFLVDYAKQNAPWKDDTGRAREGLHFILIKDAEANLELTLAYASGIEYGIYLELSNGGRYAILVPTIEVMGPQLMDMLQTNLEG